VQQACRRDAKAFNLGPKFRHSQLFLSMPNTEHLALLKQGATVWNDWRIRNPGSLPDLSEADVRQANLIGANLTGANLSKAILTGAKLDKACLTEANLSGANLESKYSIPLSGFRRSLVERRPSFPTSMFEACSTTLSNTTYRFCHT
jgi:Pentapeptide repeats (8 copies)